MFSLPIFSILIIFSSCGALFANRDGCQEIADACACANTGLQGYCFPGSLSRSPDELYCDCASDVLSDEEFYTEILEKYLSSESIRTAIRKYSQVAADTLDTIFKQWNITTVSTRKGDLSGLLKDTKIIKRITPKDIETLRAIMKQFPGIAQNFFKVFDGCTYNGKECTCSHGSRRGVCSVDRTFRKGELYCHCG